MFAYTPQPDGTVRDLHSVEEGYEAKPGEIVSDGPFTEDKTSLYSDVARAALAAQSVKDAPATRADLDALRADLQGQIDLLNAKGG